jgi:hypothetical protein
MALGRLRSIEALRYYAREDGANCWVDRAPEVRILPVKLKHLPDQEQALSCSSILCKE